MHLQISNNQLLATNVKSIDDNQVITLPTTVETFVLNGKADLLAVLQTDQQWQFYHLSTGDLVECKHKIEAKPFQLALLHSATESLWLGQLRGDILSFKVQHFNENIHYECSVKVPSEVEKNVQLVDYAFCKDRLVCVFVGEENSVIGQFRLSSKQIELVSSRLFAENRVAKLECNPDNDLLICCTENNTVLLMDEEEVSTWQIKPPSDIKTICFDVSFGLAFWVATENLLYLLYYIRSEHQIVVLETMDNKNDSPLVASQLPHLLTLSGNTVSSEQYKQLSYLQNYQKIITDMFAMDSKQFVKHLHNCDYGDKALWLTIAKRCLVDNDIQSAVYCAAKVGLVLLELQVYLILCFVTDERCTPCSKFK